MPVGDYYPDVYPNVLDDQFPSIGLVPITNFFPGTAFAAYDVSVFESLTFSGEDIVNIENLLNPGTHDMDCSSTPVGYGTLDGQPALDTNGVDEAGSISLVGSGLSPGDHMGAHVVWASIGHDGSSGWIQPTGIGGAYGRTTGDDRAILQQTVGGAIVYATRDDSVPHADDLDFRDVTGMRARRDGGSWTTGTDTAGVTGVNTAVVGRVGGNFELISLSALVLTNAPTEAQMDEFLTGFVATRFPTIAAALP